MCIRCTGAQVPFKVASQCFQGRGRRLLRATSFGDWNSRDLELVAPWNGQHSRPSLEGLLITAKIHEQDVAVAEVGRGAVTCGAGRFQGGSDWPKLTPRALHNALLHCVRRTTHLAWRG